MIDRKEFAEELILRENVRKAIKIVGGRRERRALTEDASEAQLRTLLRELIAEAQSAVASRARHDSTGINALEDLLRNSNILFVLETGFKSLTTDEQQRNSYRRHVLSAVSKSLAPEESRKEAGEDVEITEDVDIEISDRPEDDPDFIDVSEPEEEEEVEVDEKEEFGLNGEDKTGRNRAYTDFSQIEKDILTAYDDLDNPNDMAMFEEYLVKNLALYFDKYENELATDVEEPAAAAEAEANIGDVEAPAAAGTEEDTIANIELQEILKHLDIEDIIKNLL